MRYSELTELAGVKRFKDMTASEVIDFIKTKLGNGPIKLLGQGSQGAAIQIGENVYKFWMVDSAYTDFVQYCIANSSNPLLPKFQSGIKQMPAFFVRHANAPDVINYVKMEKLSHGGSSTMNYQFELNIQFEDEEDEDERGHLAHVSLEKVSTICDNISGTSNFEHQFLEKLFKGTSYSYEMDHLSEELKLFIRTVKDLRKFTNHRLDMHSGNFMFRGKQLVILDPIANEDDLALNLDFMRFDEKLFRDEGEGKQAVTSKTVSKKD